MIPYVVIIGITACFTYLGIKVKQKRARQIFFILSIVFPAFMAGIRYGIGTDYLGVYKPYFIRVVNSTDVFMTSRYEIGYELINIFVAKFLHFGFPTVMFICSIITITFIQLGLRKYKDKINITVAMTVFMLLYYQMSFNLVRQLMSVSIIFYAFTVLNKSKPKYVLLILLASCFQITSIVMLSILIIEPICTNSKYNVFKYAIIIILLILILNYKFLYSVLINIDFIKYYVGSYLRTTDSNIGIGVIARVVPFIIPFLFLSKEDKEQKDIQLMYYIFLLGSTFRVLAYVTTTYAERIALYFTISQIFLVGYYVKNIVKYRKTISIGLISYTIFLWYYDYIMQNMNETIPYMTIFQMME